MHQIRREAEAKGFWCCASWVTGWLCACDVVDSSLGPVQGRRALQKNGGDAVENGRARRQRVVLFYLVFGRGEDEWKGLGSGYSWCREGRESAESKE